MITRENTCGDLKDFFMSNVNFILAQILGLTSTIFLCLSYAVKNKKTFLILSLLGDIIYGLTFVFVNSWGAGIITLLSCLQYVIVICYENKQKQLPKYIAFIFIVGFIVAGLYDFNNLWDIVPIITYIWFTIVLYAKDLGKIRIMYLIANILLTVYDTMVMAYANAFEDGIESICLVVMIAISYHKSKSVTVSKTQNTATLTKKLQLSFGVIGVKNFDLQSAKRKVITSDNHFILTKSKYHNVTIPCLTYQYG